MNKFLTSRIVVLVCLALVSLQSFAGTISGQVQNAQSGPVANATFSFTLTAPATIAGTATVVTSSVSCYTDANGNVVGEPNPLVSPVVNANIASGTLAAGTYYTRIAYLDATGTSFAGPETATVLSSIGSLIVTAPVKQPLSATGYKVFISSASGTETLQGTVTGTPGTWANFTQSASLAAGAALPVSNTTVCTIRFNDELTPSFTCYDVGLVGSTGANISGFPQFWYLNGGSAGNVNVGSGTPQSNVCQGQGVVYPQAIITQPPFNATQTVNGGLNITGNETVGGALGVTGPATAQSYNGTLQANQFATGGSGTVGSPWTSPSGTGGIGEAIVAAGTANGGNAHIHIPAGYYNITTCINSTANITSIFANSAPPSPLILEGDGPVKTILVGNSGGCVIDHSGRVIRLTELAIIQGSSSKSTIGVYCSRTTGLVSQFSSGNVYEHLVIDLPTVPAANGGNGTAGFYVNACESNRYYNNVTSADHPYVFTSNNMWSINSAYQTIAVNLHNFVSQNQIEEGSCTTEGVSTGECILIQGHAPNTWIHNVSGECGGATPPTVFLRIKSPTTPDLATDPLPGLNMQNIQYECPTGGTLLVDDQILTNAIIQANVANVAATPIILMTANATIKDSLISVQASNAALTEPLISDGGVTDGGLQGGTIFLSATETIALTGASTCFGTNIVASYNSPSVVCANVANQDLNGIISSFNGWNLLTAGSATFGSNTSFIFNVQGSTAFTITPSYAILAKPLSFAETTAPAAAANNDICYGDSTAHNIRCSLNGATAFQNHPVTIVLHAAYSNATTTFSNISDGTRTMSWPILANTDYKLSCDFTWQGTATTTGPKFQITGPASPTLVGVNLDSAVTSTSSLYASASAFSSPVANSGTITITTNFPAQLTANVANGANAGTLVVQAAANGAGTLTIVSGSCQLQ
jgi:hypothetical protein